MGNGPTAADLLAASDNLAGSAPTPDTRHPTPGQTPDPRDATPWPILYTAVLAELVILIVAFYAFTKAFA
jgi:hypothetical protein